MFLGMMFFFPTGAIFSGVGFLFKHSSTKIIGSETNIFAPENGPGPKRKLLFQPSIFRGENVSFREGSSQETLDLPFGDCF